MVRGRRGKGDREEQESRSCGGRREDMEKREVEGGVGGREEERRWVGRNHTHHRKSQQRGSAFLSRCPS